MKIHAQEILKRNAMVVTLALMLVTLVFMVILNGVAIARASKPLIIGIDSNGARVVTESSDPIYRTEAVAFIQKFTFNTYNFDSQNFMQRIGFVTSLMSDELWKKKRSEILDLKEKIERDEVSLSGKIIKISREQSGVFHGLVAITEKSRLKIKEHEIEITVALKTVPRSQDNPYGLEVDSYEETIVRN